jgi:molecular chaperone HtpG
LLETLLGRYCVLMREPLFVGQSETAVNHLSPPWRRDSRLGGRTPSGLRQKQNIEFASRFERTFTPFAPSISPLLAKAMWSAFSGSRMARLMAPAITVICRSLRGMLLDDQARPAAAVGRLVLVASS